MGPMQPSRGFGNIMDMPLLTLANCEQWEGDAGLKCLSMTQEKCWCGGSWAS